MSEPRAATVYLTIGDLAARWGVSTRTIERWIKTGIPGTTSPFPFSQIGRKVRWTHEQVCDIEQAMTRVGFAPRTRAKRRRATA